MKKVKRAIIIAIIIYQAISNIQNDFNSPVTEIFPFSYFAFCLLAFSQLITDIKNIKTLLKTRGTDPYFE